MVPRVGLDKSAGQPIWTRFSAPVGQGTWMCRSQPGSGPTRIELVLVTVLDLIWKHTEKMVPRVGLDKSAGQPIWTREARPKGAAHGCAASTR